MAEQIGRVRPTYDCVLCGLDEWGTPDAIANIAFGSELGANRLMPDPSILDMAQHTPLTIAFGEAVRDEMLSVAADDEDPSLTLARRTAILVLAIYSYAEWPEDLRIPAAWATIPGCYRHHRYEPDGLGAMRVLDPGPDFFDVYGTVEALSRLLAEVYTPPTSC